MGAPVYTIDGKNVLGIMAFKNHFGLWFFNGVFLSDPKKILENAQEGKTKAMRHWKFKSNTFDKVTVLAYMNEAIDNQKKGLRIMPEKIKTINAEIPDLLRTELEKNPNVMEAFNAFSPYKQRDFCEYIANAKQDKTKLARLTKIIPMINQGVGLNDKYRK
jgi:uncharacterized protein YdeI (YjbR/CyaY-like superfamily)